MKLFALQISYSTKLWFIHSFPLLFSPDPDPHFFLRIRTGQNHVNSCRSGSETLRNRQHKFLPQIRWSNTPLPPFDNLLKLRSISITDVSSCPLGTYPPPPPPPYVLLSVTPAAWSETVGLFEFDSLIETPLCAFRLYCLVYLHHLYFYTNFSLISM